MGMLWIRDRVFETIFSLPKQSWAGPLANKTFEALDALVSWQKQSIFATGAQDRAPFYTFPPFPRLYCYF
jgi:hypothetical protein